MSPKEALVSHRFGTPKCLVRWRLLLLLNYKKKALGKYRPGGFLSIEGDAFDVVEFEEKLAVRCNVNSIAILSILGIIVQKHEWQDT